MSEKIRLDTNGPIGELVLNVPAKRNALSVEMWNAIPDLISAAMANPEVKVIIIHGGDSGAFAAGADISEFATVYATPEGALAANERIDTALNTIEACEKPVIAAIDGACVGGGVSIAMASDLRIASAGSKFGVTPGKLGLIYPARDTARLLAAIGPGATKEILFTGRIFSAEEAKEMGLVDRLVEPQAALKEAQALANQIASISQWSVRSTKKMIRGLQDQWSPDSKEAHALFLESFSNEDFQEGYRAFLEKRDAKFTVE